MQFSIVLVAATTLGVDFGWQPLDDGKLEYIVQIEPELLSAIQRGETFEDIKSELPPEVRGVRRIRITIGKGPLNRLGGMPKTEEAPRDLPKRGGDDNPIRPVSSEEPMTDNHSTQNNKKSDRLPDKSDAEGPPDVEPEKPWVWLTVALLGLFISLGANAYQGWIMLTIRRQYHKVVDEISGRG